MERSDAGPGYAGVRGATSRVADQSLLTATVVVWDSPAIGAASAMSAASTELGLPTFGVSSQMTPPPTRSVSESTSPSTRSPSSSASEHDCVDHVAVVAVDDVGVDGVLDGDPEDV